LIRQVDDIRVVAAPCVLQLRVGHGHTTKQTTRKLRGPPRNFPGRRFVLVFSTRERSLIMAIVVTGATGNVGGPLVARVVAAGAEVRAVSRRPDAAGLP